jgi:hypothetical protein
MSQNNIVSFSEYLKKRNKELTVDSKFVEALGDDIKNRPELMEWFQFQNAFHKHKLFLYGLFASNQREGNINPNAGYFLSFNEDQINKNKSEVLDALEWLDREPVVIEAKNCTFKNMARQLYGSKPNDTRDAWLMFEEILLNSHEVIVISNLSQSKIPTGKSGVARSLIKTNDDAHLRGIKPKSDILFIDYAAFLQRSWSEFGAYIEICA